MTDHGQPAPARRYPYLPELDGLRAVAIVLVVAAHTISGSLGRGGPWYRLGEFGVLLFFVLSGFLITGILCTSVTPGEWGGLWEFYVRRVLRIFPAAYAFLGLWRGPSGRRRYPAGTCTSSPSRRSWRQLFS
jgi:peptidoglycan/LPS O-acetylase OafA/YrhL